MVGRPNLAVGGPNLAVGLAPEGGGGSLEPLFQTPPPFQGARMILPPPTDQCPTYLGTGVGVGVQARHVAIILLRYLQLG